MKPLRRCPKCKGTGTVLRHFRIGHVWSVWPKQKRCVACLGTGKVLPKLQEAPNEQ